MRKPPWFRQMAGLFLGGLLLGQAAPGLAQESSVSIYAGALSVDSGFDDRYFAGVFIDHYIDNGLVGVHAEASGVAREEDAGFFAGGVSYAFGEVVRPRVMVGTSTDNDGILPELYVRGSVEIRSKPELGLVVTPALTYRDYRNGIEEIVPGLDVAIYLPPFADGTYIIAQAIGMVMFVDPGDNRGFEVGGGASVVKPELGSIGLTVTAGKMAYDALLVTGRTPVENDFVSVRPNAGIFLTNDIELFVRGDFTFTDFYDAAGGLAGLKISF